MDNFSGFLNMFFNSQFFSVVIVILILVLLMVLSYLIKSQRYQIKSLEEKVNLNKENNVSLEVKEETKLKEEVKEAQTIKSEAPIKEKGVLNISSLENTTANLVLDLKSDDEEVKEVTEPLNPIIEYELNEEENAVISTKELEAIEKERDETFGKENNAKLIEEYEQEQEKKAIISYNELLKNANTLELSYIEKPKEEENAPIVKQVEIKEQPFKGVSYTAEEEYLKILKDFKVSLMSNG